MAKYSDEILLEFLQGNLETDVHNAIQNDLTKDPELQKELDLQRTVLAIIELSGEESLKNHLNEILPNSRIKALPKPKRNYWLWAASAAAAIALLVLGSQFLFQNQTSASSIYANHYTAYELNFGTRGSSSDDQVQQAGAFYQSKDYAKAQALFKEILEGQENAKYRLALGVSQLETQQHADAIRNFQEIIDAQDPVYESHARWYKALTHLKLNQLQLAQKEFSILATDSEAFQHEAAKKISTQKLF